MQRTTPLIACLAVGLVALGACATTSTGSATSASGAPRITTAAQLADAVSASADRAGTVHFTTRKVDDFVAAAGVGVLKLGSPTQIDDTVTGAATFAPSQQNSTHVITTGGKAYLTPPKALLSPGEPPWLQVHPSLPAWQSQSRANLLAPYFEDAVQDTDPTVLIRQLAPAATIASATPATLDGVSTTNYVLSVDLAKLAASLPANSDRKELYQSVARQGTKTMSVDVWLSSAQLPVRYSMTLAGHDAIQNKTVTYTFVGTYSQWGQPVTIAPPAADQVSSQPGL